MTVAPLDELPFGAPQEFAGASQRHNAIASAKQLARDESRSRPGRQVSWRQADKSRFHRSYAFQVTDVHPFHILLPPHGAALHRFALKLSAQEHRAEDLVQETFLKAWANRDKFRLGTELRAWLFTILRNTFYSDLRKKKREVEDVDGKLAALLFEDAAQEHAIELKALASAIAVLPEIQRRPLVLMGAYGFSQVEAAAACGCSVGTIKSRVSRGRSSLSRAVAPERATPMSTRELIRPIQAARPDSWAGAS